MNLLFDLLIEEKMENLIPFLSESYHIIKKDDRIILISGEISAVIVYNDYALGISIFKEREVVSTTFLKNKKIVEYILQKGDYHAS